MAPRDEVRAAVYAAEYGAHLILERCELDAIRISLQHFENGKALAMACIEFRTVAHDGVATALDQLDGPWSLTKGQIVACSMRDTVKFFDAVQAAVEVSPEVQDGAARARWLAAGCNQ
jgi:hypothetical protein